VEDITMSEETAEKQKEVEKDKEIEKLKYYLEPIDDIIEEGDYAEIEVVKKRTDAIFYKVNNLVASVQELKIDRGAETQRAI
jgi:predicted house-cleaning noncanonical NTP pyrophosphatase (MazG superfamily)